MITLNLQGGCTAVSGSRGTGLGSCIKQFGDPTGLDFTDRSWSLDTATDTLPTESEWKADVQDFKILPLNNLVSFTDNTPESEINTGTTGIKTKVRAGLPEYSYIYGDGYCFHKNVYSLEGQNRWNVVYKFDAGIFFATDPGETVLKGFKVGMVDVSTFKFKNGTDNEQSVLTFQLPSAEELNKRGVFYTWDEFGFDANDVNGAINAALKFQTAPVAGTTFNVYVNDDCNRSSIVQGLTDANNWNVLGEQTTPAAVSGVSYNANGYYTLTVDNAVVSTDTIGFTLADVTNGYAAAVNASGDIYVGSTDIKTIA